MEKIRIAASAASASLALVACLALAGCGAQDPTQNPDEAGGPSVTAPAQPDPSQPDPTPPDFGQPGSVPPTRPGQPPTQPGRTLKPGGPGPTRATGPMTLTGTIIAGVEPGCVLLDNYLLVGGEKALLRAGARVTVTGEVRTDLMTTCQQGTPFLVQSAERA